MDRHQRFAYLFRRYLDKTCTPQEREEFFVLLQEEEHDDTLRRLISETWNEDLPDHPIDKARGDALLRRILSRREPETPADGFRVYAIPFYRCAAVAIGIALLTFLAVHLFRSSPVKTLTPPPALAVSQPTADRCITLPDGSKVLLHKAAQLAAITGFTPTTRELTLTGEAYFDIRRDVRPFIVHTGRIRTTVLGTAFNIDATGGHNIVITVLKGKVKVENARGEYSILRRNEQLLVDSLHDRLQKIKVDAAEVLAWKKSYLLFNDVTMAEAMTELGLRYHLTVDFTNPLAGGCPVTASFIRGESLEEMVKVLARINNMEYSISRDRITIRGEGCN